MSVAAPSLSGSGRSGAADRHDGLLLTGATGFLGTELLARYLQRSDRPIYAIVRAADDNHAQRRLRATLTDAFGSAEPFADRVRAVAGDMTKPGLGLDPPTLRELAENVDEIVHGAAAVSFDLDLEQARAINVQGARAMLEAEILTLENAANPLERGSEDRVRRLAYLKRQRGALRGSEKDRDALNGKLETCALALQNMRFDMSRLGASPQSYQQITSLANQAMRLAENVDDAVFVADEMGRLGGRSSASRRAPVRG